MPRARRDETQGIGQLRAALTAGADLAGTVGGSGVGAILGVATGGAVGAMVGAGAGWAIEQIVAGGLEIVQKILAPRAAMRVGAVFRLADDEVSARLMRGDVAQENIRVEISPGRTAAAELVEAAFIAAAEMYEERKLPHLAHLLAAIVFEPDLTHAHANQLIETSKALSYRQLLILSAMAARQPHAGDSPNFIGQGHEYDDDDDARSSVRADMLDLFHRGLLKTTRQRISSGMDSLPLGDARDLLPWPALPREMSPRDTWASSSGKRLAQMMRLDLASPDDVQALVLDHIGR